MASGLVVSWVLCALLAGMSALLLVANRRLRAQERRRAAGATTTAAADDGVARHDRLTGLPNRALLVEILEAALGRARRLGTRVAVVIVGVEELTETWERLGHRAAEELVTTAAGRLATVVRPGDLVARTGVDEFALLLEGFEDVEQVLGVAQQAVSTLSTPVTVGGHSLHGGAGAGIALGHPDAPTERAEELIHQAGVAAALARSAGPGQTLVFDDAMRTQASPRHDLTVDLRTAASEGQIRAVYQPVVRLSTLDVAGFEALARWDHPDRGEIPPASFIPIAEDTGDIVELGRFVLTTACSQLASWRDEHPGRPLSVGVNISPRQLADPRFVEDVRGALADSGLPAEQLVLEITESALPHDVASVQARLQELRELGVLIAMDDFGTGFSSLAHLRRLPLDILKIDRSFIDDRSPSGPRLLAAVIDIGTQLGLDTVAEGIELPEQLEAARSAGCTFGQGYLIARPLEADAAAAFIAEHSGRPRGDRTVEPD